MKMQKLIFILLVSALCLVNHAAAQSYFSVTYHPGSDTATFDCPNNDVSITKHEDRQNCAGYFECSKGKAVHKTCKPGRFFNSNAKICDTFRNSGCKYIKPPKQH